jgi:hypothetical protein
MSNTQNHEATPDDQQAGINSLWALEAKALAVLAFRNGPIEDVHASRRITEDEMKRINKHAVNSLYRLISLKRCHKSKYIKELDFGLLYAKQWDDPEESQLTA